MGKQKIKNTLKSQLGFSLVEVLIAIAIFSIFTVSFVTGLGYNLLDSSSLKDEIILKNLCESKINEIITNPPELKESLTLSKETKAFENFSEYTYTLQYKKFPVPDLNKIMPPNSNDSEDNGQAETNKKIFSTFKENMEKMLWQVEVSVKNKTTERSFTLSAWILNPQAEVKIGAF